MEEIAPPARSGLERLRRLVADASADLVEEIKWNAPSYTHKGMDRVTLGLERNGGFRLVLHRGAKPKDTSGFTFKDTSGLARWPSADRGVVRLKDEGEIDEKADALRRLISDWVSFNAAN